MVNSTSRRWSWSRRKASSVRRAWASRLRADREVANRGGTRPTRAHRRAARCRTLARSEKRPRVRAKAVRNQVSLCFSSVSRAPGPSMSPLIMSHINRTRPRQGLQLVIRRVAGPQISHLPTRQRGSRHSPRSRVLMLRCFRLISSRGPVFLGETVLDDSLQSADSPAGLQTIGDVL